VCVKVKPQGAGLSPSLCLPSPSLCLCLSRLSLSLCLSLSLSPVVQDVSSPFNVVSTLMKKTKDGEEAMPHTQPPLNTPLSFGLPCSLPLFPYGMFRHRHLTELTSADATISHESTEPKIEREEREQSERIMSRIGICAPSWTT